MRFFAFSASSSFRNAFCLGSLRVPYTPMRYCYCPNRSLTRVGSVTNVYCKLWISGCFWTLTFFVARMQSESAGTGTMPTD